METLMPEKIFYWEIITQKYTYQEKLIDIDGAHGWMTERSGKVGSG